LQKTIYYKCGRLTLSIAEILWSLAPEIALFIGGVTVLAIDMVWKRVDEEREATLLGLSVGFLILAFVLLIGLGWSWGIEGKILEMLAVDRFGLFFKLLAVVVTALVLLTSYRYLEGRTPYRGEFYALFLFATLAIMLTVSAVNLLMVYLAFEFLSITSYILVGYLREDSKSNEAAIKYFLYGATASALMLYGMSLLYGVTGTLDLAQVADALVHSQAGGWLAFPAIVLLLAGFGFKIALVPFHQWSPDTYEGAPTPVTAFLSVGPKSAGFAVLMRVFLTALPYFQVEWVAVLAGISMITMTLGNLVALRQENIKRMLAYSSIAHAGYILIGFVCLAKGTASNFTGINGVLIYLLAYLFTNIGAFTVVIAFERATGSNRIADYAGLIKRSPLLAGVMAIFLFSLIGIPGTGGFIGKLFVFGAAIQVQFYVLALVAILNSVVSAFYYLNVVRHMFFLPGEAQGTIGVSPLHKWVLAICLVLTFLIGLYPQPFISLGTTSVQILAAVL